jgi:hypothetical protein
MNCACHDKPMYFNKDKRATLGGHWECKEKRRTRNALRLRVFGNHVYMPDIETKQFATRLREERRNDRS